MRLCTLLGINILIILCLSGCSLFPADSSQKRNTEQTEASVNEARGTSYQDEQTSVSDENEPHQPGTKVDLSTSSEDPEENTQYNEDESSSDHILTGKIICVDPGHGVTSETKQELMSPKSRETKAAYVSGASGEYQTEEELNLAVAKLVKNKLEALGAEVIMTRTKHDVAVSNIERAEIANDANADICIRIHADGTENSSANGFSILVPSGDLLGNPSIIEPSREVAEAVETSLSESTGARDRGIVEREDLTGFNWSEVPVILVEMGFLSNSEEDEKMSTDSYREKLAEGISNGIEKWLTE